MLAPGKHLPGLFEADTPALLIGRSLISIRDKQVRHRYQLITEIKQWQAGTIPRRNMILL